jgi:hypothetical protein
MYVLTSTTTRPDTSYEFWWFSGLQPAGFFNRSAFYTNAGDLLSFQHNISIDGLTLTRVLNFKDQATAFKIISEEEISYPGLFDEKNAYNALHGHVETKVYTTV